MPNMAAFASKVRQRVLGRSPLDLLIPPEVANDAFSQIIKEVAARPEVHTALEIGSSSGAGSTASLVAGMKDKEEKALHCIELSTPRFRELTGRYKDLPWVHCYNLPSIALDEMPTEADLASFFKAHPDSAVHQVGLRSMTRWLRQDIDYMKRHERGEAGIQVAREKAGVETFDLVLIDGSEFTGRAELQHVYGATYVLLDDTRTFKTYEACERLRQDACYELVAEDRQCRGGFAVFQRR